MGNASLLLDAVLVSLLATCCFVLGIILTLMYMSAQRYASKRDFRAWEKRSKHNYALLLGELTLASNRIKSLEQGVKRLSTKEHTLKKSVQELEAERVPAVHDRLGELEDEFETISSWMTRLADNSRVLMGLEPVLQHIGAMAAEGAAPSAQRDRAARRFAAKMVEMRAFHRSGGELAELIDIVGDMASAFADRPK